MEKMRKTKPIKLKHWSEALHKLGACKNAVKWAATQSTPEAAWKACKRGDWLLWIAVRTCKHGSEQHRKVVLAACKCARLVSRRNPHVLSPAEIDGQDKKLLLVLIRRMERWAKRTPGVTLCSVQRAAAAAALNCPAVSFAVWPLEILVTAAADREGQWREARRAADAAASVIIEIQYITSLVKRPTDRTCCVPIIHRMVPMPELFRKDMRDVPSR